MIYIAFSLFLQYLLEGHGMALLLFGLSLPITVVIAWSAAKYSEYLVIKSFPPFREEFILGKQWNAGGRILRTAILGRDRFGRRVVMVTTVGEQSPEMKNTNYLELCMPPSFFICAKNENPIIGEILNDPFTLTLCQDSYHTATTLPPFNKWLIRRIK